MKRKLPTGLVMDLLLNGLLPYLAYGYVTDHLHWSEVKALIWISVIPLVVALVTMMRERRLDWVAGFSLFGIVMSLIAAMFSSDTRMLLIRESYCTLLIGVIFLGSAVIRRPILWTMAVSQLRDDPEKAQLLREAIVDPDRRKVFYGMTYMWGWSMVAEVAVKIWMVNRMTPARVLFWGPVSTYGITGLTVGATFLLVYRTRARMRREDDIWEAEQAAANLQSAPG